MHEWKEEMGEISGFGGDYEKLCRDMVLRGVAWLEENPTADPAFREVKSVFGIIEDGNDDATAMAKAILGEDEPTGAMMHACVRQVLYVKLHGWDKYVAERSKPAPAGT